MLIKYSYNCYYQNTLNPDTSYAFDYVLSRYVYLLDIYSLPTFCSLVIHSCMLPANTMMLCQLSLEIYSFY